MKKLLCLVVFLAVIIFTVPSVYASTHDSEIKIYVNDTRIDPSGSFLEEGRTFIPIRVISTTLGDGEVTWVEETQSAILYVNGSKFEFFVNDNIFKANDQVVESDQCLFLFQNSQIFLQARLFVPFLGASITWDGEMDAIVIEKDNAHIPDDLVYVAPPVEEKMIKEVKATYSEEDLYWLSRIVEAEARGESYEGKLAVANVVLNRVKTPGFPNSVKAVIFDRASGVQFTPTVNGHIHNTPSQESIDAAIEALEGNNNIGSALYFTAYRSNSWASKNRKLYKILGVHGFYY